MPRQANFTLTVLALTALLLGCGQGGGDANLSPEDFYRGKTVRIVVGLSSGGGYDAAARVLARHIGKHIPGNPRVIVENQPGAGSLVAANVMTTAGPKDGTTIGIFTDTIPFTPIWTREPMRYDPRTLGWLGSLTSRDTPMLVVRSNAPATTLEEVRNTEITVGATGPESSTSSYAKLANEMLGTKLKPVLGYAGSTEIYLAMERGEVDGRASTNLENLSRIRPHWVESGFAKAVVLFSTENNSTLPDIPLAIDYARNEEDRDVMRLVFGTQKFGRTFVVREGVPPDRLQALQQAFRDVVQDLEFIADAKAHMNEALDVSYPEDIAKFINDAYAYPQSVRDRAGQYIASDD